MASPQADVACFAGVNKVVSQVYALNYVVIFATLGPLAQLSFYVSDRKFYLSDVSAYLYR